MEVNGRKSSRNMKLSFGILLSSFLAASVGECTFKIFALLQLDRWNEFSNQLTLFRLQLMALGVECAF